MSAKEHILSYLRFETDDLPETPVFFTGPMPNIVGADYPMCERSVFYSGYDAYGVHWTQAEPASHATPGQPEIISDIEQWQEQLRLPNPDKLDWDYVSEYAKMMDCENNVVALTMNIGPFERTTMLSTFENCLVNLISEPELFSDVIGALADLRIELLSRTHERMKLDVVNFHDDWGTTKGPIMNPELWREVMKPHTKRMYDAAKSMGIIVCQHSCGNLGEIVDEMVDMGAAAWEAQFDCQDMNAIESRVKGKLRILANPASAAGDGDGNKLPPPPVFPRQLSGYEQVPVHLYD